MNKARSKLIQKWLSLGDDDLLYAEIGLRETELYANVCFSCQQSFEKLIKTYLTYKNIDFPKTHDLTRLLGSCLNVDKDFSHFKEAAITLTTYSINTRYPDMGDINFSKKDAEQALNFVKDFKKFILAKIKY